MPAVDIVVASRGLAARPRRAAIALLLALLLPGAASAQDPPPAAAPPPEAAPRRSAPGDSVYSEEDVGKLLVYDSPQLRAEVHGFVSLEYYALRDQPVQPDNSFDIHNVFLSTKATVASFVSLFVEVEYEHGSTVKLDRAFVDFAIDPLLTVRAGRFSVPLSYERVHYAAPVRLMTSRPFAVDVAFHEWTDTGIEAFGRAGIFGYTLGLFNGPQGLSEAGIPNVDVSDNNSNKTVVARLNLYPAPFFEAGASGSAGTYDPGGQRWFYLAELDARLQRGALDVWAEADYRAGDDEPCSAAVDAGCSPIYSGQHANLVGYYVAASYSLIRDAHLVRYLKPIVRYDELDDLKAHTAERRVTFGLNWSPVAHVVVKSELQWTLSTGAPRAESQALMMSVVADF